MGRKISLFVTLVVTWLLWSGHYTGLIITFGVLSCLLVTMIAHKMKIDDQEGHPIHLLTRLLTYIPWLFWAIVKSNVDIAIRILKPGMPISPRIIKVKASQQTDVGRVIYANSITLTPGTVSVDLDGDEILVHALTSESAVELEAGDMDRRVSKVEGAA